MGFIVILEDDCKGCQLCIPTCKHELIRPVKDRVNKRGLFPVEFIDPEGKCNACMLCAIVCPDVAIKVYREEKKAKQEQQGKARELSEKAEAIGLKKED